MFSDPEKIITQFSIGKGTHVADIGAGSGAYALAAAKMAGETGRVYAVDVQKDLLARLKKEAEGEHLKNIEIVWADIEEAGGTKLRERSMDVVIAANVFFQLPDKDAACREIRRILADNGRALLVDWAASYGAIGPRPDAVFTRETAKKLFEKQGFALDREIVSAGAHHYGLVFRKA
ncbi:MAG: methyltransferase domain-containing protein [Patescibacteria group bacterium]|nr:methyltransferase domain-containing protein [Patescibacteria group bacterium]MDE1946048.1 methyltransferase domain-containing protein [Patescibacteria group bacterium]